MRHLANFLLLPVVVGCAGALNKSPDTITAAELSIYKLGIATGCRDAGHRRGDPEPRVTEFCSCMSRTLDNRMSEGEWKQATYFAQLRKDADEQRILAPHLPALTACRGSAS